MIKKNTKNLYTTIIWKCQFTPFINSEIIYQRWKQQKNPNLHSICIVGKACDFSSVNLARLDTRANSSISLASLPAGSPRAEMSVCNNHGDNSMTRGLQSLRVPIGGDCQINKMLHKIKSMQKSNKFKASLSSFEEIRMLDVKLN